MVIGFLLYRLGKVGKRSWKRTNERRKEAKAKGKTSDLPAYMQPGYREEVEARRRAEEAGAPRS